MKRGILVHKNDQTMTVHKSNKSITKIPPEGRTVQDWNSRTTGVPTPVEVLAAGEEIASRTATTT